MTRFMIVIVALFALVASAAAQPARGSKKKGKTVADLRKELSKLPGGT